MGLPPKKEEESSGGRGSGGGKSEATSMSDEKKVDEDPHEDEDIPPPDPEPHTHCHTHRRTPPAVCTNPVSPRPHPSRQASVSRVCCYRTSKVSRCVCACVRVVVGEIEPRRLVDVCLGV